MKCCFMFLMLLVFVSGATGRYAGQDRAMFEAGSNSDQEDLENAGLCIECLLSTDVDETMDGSDDVDDCLTYCMEESDDSKRALEDVGTRRWRPGKHLKPWIVKNKDNIIQGIKTVLPIMVALKGK